MLFKRSIPKLLFIISFALILAFNKYTQKVQASSPIVWLEDGLTRVYKTDPAKLAPSISLFSAKNEYEPFQIIVKAPGGSNLTNVNVSVSDLSGPDGNIIDKSNIQLFREHYLYVTSGSKNWSGQTNPPLGPGWYPDALIPFKDPETGLDLTGRFDAVPFTVLAGENQPVWADIFVPQGIAAGSYFGNVAVTSEQGTELLNINLNVWNFTLPQTRSLKGQGQLRWDSPYNTLSSNIELIKHRMNPKTVANADERLLIDQYGFDRRNVFTASGASYGNCVSAPAPTVADVAAEAARHQPDLYLFNSYANEVWQCTDLFPTFMQWAANLRAGGVHPEIVSHPVDGLMGTDLDHTAADVWYILPKHYDLAVANINLLVNHPGTYVMSYNPLVQEGYSPKFTIDFLPINARIMQGFINQSLGLTGTKFWRVDNWTTDPWTDPNLTNQSGVPVPGEAAMVYPGADVGLPDKIVSGVRMKLFREGSEDYEYVEILKNAGLGQFALDTIRSVAMDFHNWTKDKNELLSVRNILGNKIHEIYQPVPSPTVTVEPSPTETPTPTPTNSPTPTPTNTPTPTLTPTMTPSPSPTPANLIQNGGFEFDVNSNGSPDYWTINNQFTRSVSSVHSGGYSGRHSSSSNIGYTIQQTIDSITPITSYTFTGWTNIPPTSDSFTYKLQLRWLDSGGATIRTDTLRKHTASTNGWVKTVKTITSPSSSASVLVRMVVSSLKTTLYADDFTLIGPPNSTPTPTN